MPSAPIHPALVCPDCRAPLANGTTLTCTGCGRSYPLATNGVPVLLPLESAFEPDKAAAGVDNYHAARSAESERKRRIRRGLPGLATDLQANAADRLANDLLAPAADASTGTVDGLVVGAGFRVEEYAGRFPQVNWLITDTEATFGASVVGDVCGLPVADASQDVVLCEHVLEHVLDPFTAAREIERVLKPGGIAVIKVPFNYPWHGGYIDFFRLTPAGYLSLFRRTEPVHIGHGPGPASTVTYAVQGAWVSLFRRRTARRMAVGIGRIILGPWKQLDRVLVRKPDSLGSACSMIFIGRRVETERTGPQVIAAAKALGIAPVLHPDQRPRPT